MDGMQRIALIKFKPKAPRNAELFLEFMYKIEILIKYAPGERD